MSRIARKRLKIPMMKMLELLLSTIRGGRVYGLLAGIVLILLGCSPDQRILRSSNAGSTGSNIERKAPTIADDIEAMRNADFTFIYVLRRKDGSEMDAEDKGVIRMNTADANRRVSAEDGKAFLIGTNTPLAPKNMMALYARFSVENYSKPENAENSNSAAPK
jgi:hypothetical protein